MDPQLILNLFGLVFTLALYFIPATVAFSRSHHNTLAICVTNLLLGWTVLGWIIALIWSCTAVKK